MNKQLSKLLNTPLPSKKEDDLEVMVEGIIDSITPAINNRISFMKNFNLSPTRLFNNHKTVKYIVMDDVECYCYDNVSYVESMRMAQCVYFYWNGVLEKVYSRAVDLFKKEGVNLSIEKIQQLMPFDHGEIVPGNLYLAFGYYNENKPSIGNKYILVKICNFNKLYTEFDLYTKINE